MSRNLVRPTSSSENETVHVSKRFSDLLKAFQRQMAIISNRNNPSQKGYSPQDIPAPETPSPGVSGRDRITPGPQSKAALELKAGVDREGLLRRKCVSDIDKLFENSPIIIFMNSELKKLGVPPPIYCAPCIEPHYGGFNPQLGIII